MRRGKHHPTHDERERAFENIFGSVRADSGGTGMGATDKERDVTFQRLSFDQLPKKPTDFELPDVTLPKVEHASLMDDISSRSPSKESKPLQLDEKTKKFVALFDHVTAAQSTAYGGQSVQPDTPVSFEQLPEKREEDELPEVGEKIPERDFLKEEQEERERLTREKPVRVPSKRYSEAHEAYVVIFGETEDQN